VLRFLALVISFHQVASSPLLFSFQYEESLTVPLGIPSVTFRQWMTLQASWTPTLLVQSLPYSGRNKSSALDLFSLWWEFLCVLSARFSLLRRLLSVFSCFSSTCLVKIKEKSLVTLVRAGRSVKDLPVYWRFLYLLGEINWFYLVLG